MRRHHTKFLTQLVAPFPVAGVATWSNDWHAFRPCPYPHLHVGLDIFAPGGTPVVSPFSAVVTQKVDDPVMSGLAVGVTDGHGIKYFYAHLSGFAAGLHIGEHVASGQVLGYVGNSGDARGGPTHLHFQIEPGRTAVPPKPYVDRWLRQAERRARKTLSARLRERAPPQPSRSKRAVMIAGEGPSLAERVSLASETERPGKPADGELALALFGAILFPVAGIFAVRRLRR
jgi:murein DD-endopeptidase MepM/ murein hydrolase activator NlpD